MRIGVHVLFYPEGLVLALEHYAYVHVEGRGVRGEAGIVGILDIASGPLGVKPGVDIGLHIVLVQIFQAVETALRVNLGLRVAVRIGNEQPRHACGLRHLGVICTEGRSDMHYAGTVFRSNIVSQNHAEGAFARIEPRDELLVAHALQFGTLEAAREHFVRNLVTKPSAYQSLREDVGGRSSGIWIGAPDLYVIYVRAYAESGVARKGPWGCGPCEEVQVLFAHHLELRAAGGVLHVAVAARLVELVRTQTCPGGRTVGLYGLALVEVALAVDVLEKIPESLDVAVVVGDVRVVHIHPIAYPLCEVAPLGGVLHHLAAAGGVVLFD